MRRNVCVLAVGLLLAALALPTADSLAPSVSTVIVWLRTSMAAMSR